MLLAIGTQTITTPRLVLRRFELLDFPDVYRNWTGDVRVAKFMRWSPHENAGQTAQVVHQWVKEYRDPLCFHWAICPAGERRPVGSLRLFVADASDERGEVGYSLSPRLWGKGLIPEGLSAVLKYGFDRVGFHRIEGFHAIENPASGRVMEKVGMQYEGIFPGRCRLHDGHFVDCKGYGMLVGQFPR